MPELYQLDFTNGLPAKKLLKTLEENYQLDFASY